MSEKSDKAQQLAQNIKSTCQKLKDQTDKPYTRPGKGEGKVWNSLEDLNQLLDDNSKKYVDPDITWDIE